MVKTMWLQVFLVSILVATSCVSAMAAFNPKVVKVGVRTDCAMHKVKELWVTGTLVEGAGHKILGDMKFVSGSADSVSGEFRFVNTADGSVVFTESEWYWDPWDAHWNTSGVASGTYQAEAKSTDNSNWIKGPLVQIVNISDYKITSARVSAPVESYYDVKSEEHYEVGGKFGFKLVDSSGSLINPAPACLRYRLEDTDAGNDLLTTGVGNSFEYQFKLGTDEGDVYCYFYYDFDNSDSYDSWSECYKDSVEFWVMKRKMHSFKTDVSSLARITAAQVQQFYRDAEDILIKKDSADDWRACVWLNAETTNTFTPGPARPDPVVHTASWTQEKLHWDAPSDITIVDSMTGDTYSGVTEYVGSNNIILIWGSANSRTMAHELGHSLGIEGDYSSPTKNIMYANWSTTKDHLHQSEAKVYDGGD